MGWGGRRSGSGRKSKKSAVVLGLDGKRRDPLGLPAPLSVGSDADLMVLQPPTDMGLSPDAIAVWRRLAPYAVRERTLVESRIPGFIKLCLEWSYCCAFRARIAELGAASTEADRLLKRLNDFSKLLNSSLSDYNLSSFGKPVAPEKPKAKANPFARIG